MMGDRADEGRRGLSYESTLRRLKKNCSAGIVHNGVLFILFFNSQLASGERVNIVERLITEMELMGLTTGIYDFFVLLLFA